MEQLLRNISVKMCLFAYKWLLYFLRKYVLFKIWTFFFIFVQIQLFLFSTHNSLPVYPSPLPTLDPTLFGSAHVFFIYVHWWPLPNCPHYSSPPSPLVTDSVFFISMSLVIFCLFVWIVDYVPLVGLIIWYLFFTGWFISLSIMLSRSIHAVRRVGAPSFFLLCNIPLCKYTSFLIHSFTDGHLGCFQPLAIVNCAAMNIGCIGSFELVFQSP